MASVRFADMQFRPVEFLDFTSVTLDEFQQLVPVWPKYSCGLAIVVFQEPTEPLSARDWPFTIIGRLPGTKRNHIAESLMTTFVVVMLDVLPQYMTQ